MELVRSIYLQRFEIVLERMANQNRLTIEEFQQVPLHIGYSDVAIIQIGCGDARPARVVIEYSPMRLDECFVDGFQFMIDHTDTYEFDTAECIALEEERPSMTIHRVGRTRPYHFAVQCVDAEGIVGWMRFADGLSSHEA